MRFFKEPFERKLGHLASDLARLSAFIENDKNLKAAEDILEESKFFIEWTAQEAPSHVQELLSAIQIKLALLQRRLFAHNGSLDDIMELKKSTKDWSEHLIEISGLAH